MLIRIILKNFLSFKEETEFNMLTGDIRRHPHHVFRNSKVDILKSAVIYGSNGAGKSNLIHAVDFLRDFIVDGENSFSNESKFKLEDMSNKPTFIGIDFIIKNKGYSYGISFNEDSILEEWLYALGFNKKKDELIFDRKVTKKGKSKINLHEKYLKAEKNKVLVEIYEEDFLDKNTPFLHLGVRFKDIFNAYSWFSEKTLLIFPHAHFTGLGNLFVTNDDFKTFTNNLIREFQTGVDELETLTLDFDAFFGEDNLNEKERLLKKVLSGDIEPVEGHGNNVVALLENGKPVVKKIVSLHKNLLNEKVKFELFEESDGTLRLLDFIPALFLIIYTDLTIFIDEVDQSIHPALLKEFIEKILSSKEQKGQLIFTTHESNLLDLNLFRQDEIWFAEKNQEEATSFYPLSDFDIRTDLDIRKGYLSGRFGAIPFLANLKDLNWLGND